MATKKTPAVATPVNTNEATVNNQLIGLTDDALRGLSVLSASMLFASPAFAAQASPTNVVGLADLFFDYAKGNVKVNQPSDEVANPPAPNNPTFA